MLLSGKVSRTGLVEVAMGTKIRDIVFDIGGGIPNDKQFKAVQIGGPSGGCIPTQHLDIEVDYESLKTVGAMMGSGGLVVMDEDTCMVDIAKFFMDFIQRESCGKCIPCREGTRRMLEILKRITSGRRSETGIRGARTIQGRNVSQSSCGSDKRYKLVRTGPIGAGPGTEHACGGSAMNMRHMFMNADALPEPVRNFCGIISWPKHAKAVRYVQRNVRSVRSWVNRKARIISFLISA